MRRRRRRIAAAAGLAVVGVVLAGAAIGSVVQPEASPKIGPAPASSTGSGGCVVPDRFAEEVEMGLMTEERACEVGRFMERARAIRDGLVTPDYSFPEGPSLVVEGQVHDDTVAECRAGTYDSGDGFADLYCNAFLMIAAGDLKPNDTCGPPACPEEDTPVWAYGEKNSATSPSNRREGPSLRVRELALGRVLHFSARPDLRRMPQRSR